MGVNMSNKEIRINYKFGNNINFAIGVLKEETDDYILVVGLRNNKKYQIYKKNIVSIIK